MKKFNRVDLKSQLYREHPSKSPQHSRTPRKNNESTVRTYQNICCPNCRYLFRAPKQEIVVMGQQSPKNFNQEKKLSSKPYIVGARSIQVQTEAIYISPRASSKREPTRAQILEKSKTPKEKNFRKIDLFQDRESKSPLGSIKKNQNPGSNTDRSSIYEMWKKTANKTDRSQYPDRSPYMARNNQSPQTPAQKLAQAPTKSQKKPILLNSHQKEQKKINNTQINQIMDKIYLTSDIMSLLEYNMDLPSEISVPSYCKMLMYDLMDRQKGTLEKGKSESELET